jgi:iron(III) transport system substrate-binding protein
LRGFAALALVLVVGLGVGYYHLSYSSGSEEVVAAARKEKRLVIYSVVHADAAVQDLLSAFRRRYPFIEISHADDDGARTYRRFKTEIAAGKPSADFIWSSAMDLQEKLINDGLSLPYSTPEMPYLPGWAHWQDLGYGVTLEPIAMVYNKKYLSAHEMPQSHAAFRELLIREAQRLEHRVAVYNPETSEVGMLLLSQDIRVTHDSWDLFDALGETKAELYNTSRDMLLNIISGNQWIGYDVIASYAMEMQKTNPELEVVFPTDYVLVLSRVAFVTASARHPNTAKLFLDFLLSKEGQSILRRHGMGTVRNDMTIPGPQSDISPVRTQAIRIGPGLLSDLDGLVRAQFLRRWRQSRT